ncbi:MAG: Rha family transcriptional regulator [Clostridiales bacterium]|nr:Rha family transcriptional regulator [Clostridiales bacterium]
MLVEIVGKRNEEKLITTSLKVAEIFEKEHRHILESIRNLVAENSAAKFFRETTYKNRGKEYPMYEMDRDGFSLLVMGFTGDKALKWKIKYIEAFNTMEKELRRIYTERQQWQIERDKGVVIRHILTDTIKLKVAESPNKRFAYPNYTKLIYKTLFGKGMSELKEQYGVKGKETIRDYLTSEELRQVESMEMLVSSLINCGWGYEQIKEFIQKETLKLTA